MCNMQTSRERQSSTIQIRDNYRDCDLNYWGTGNLWPPRSPDLTTPDFFLWGYLKDRVYATRPQTLDDLKHNITQEIQAIDNRVLQRVASNMERRVELCLMQDGGHFQHLLYRVKILECSKLSTAISAAIFREVMSEQKVQRIKEHKRNLRLYYPEKSAVAQHSIEKEHKILFDHTKVINKSSHHWDRTIKEAIEIKLEKNNFNRDRGLQLSQAWTPALDQLRPSYNQGHEDHGPRTATDSNRRNRARRPPNFTQESREGRSLQGMTIPGPGLADPPTNPVSPETA
ncbi:hypothetical protein ANN_27087 [Periplaneta americana]|uniref:Uncharacterized protein n=1 Tax=Periplaneta americana TaxID=6978 RepID=A0ABQ8RXB7_PERAM|nr:hypothetical protein ANN_27087 [Periplaneta americana]